MKRVAKYVIFPMIGLCLSAVCFFGLQKFHENRSQKNSASQLIALNSWVAGIHDEITARTQHAPGAIDYCCDAIALESKNLYRVSDTVLTRVSGGLYREMNWEDLGVVNTVARSELNITIFDNIVYRVWDFTRDQIVGALNEGRYLMLQSFDWPTEHRNLSSRVYLINRSAKVIYSNDRSISASTILTRPLVRAFSDSELSNGQLIFALTNGDLVRGAFVTVPHSNLVAFNEEVISRSDLDHPSLPWMGSVLTFLLAVALLNLGVFLGREAIQ
jgi:hypothetical protein